VKRADDVPRNLQMLIKLLSSIQGFLDEDLGEAISDILSNYRGFRKSKHNFNGGVNTLSNEVC